MYLNRMKFSHNNQPLILLHALCVFLICYILAKFIISRYFAHKILFFHSVTEIICLSISLVIFTLIWFTYDRNNIENQILGFGFLSVSLFQLMHIITFSTLRDFTLWYMLLARYIELVIIFLILSNKIRKFKLSKMKGTFLTLVFSIIIWSLVFINKQNLPVLYHIDSYMSLRFIFEIFLLVITIAILLYIIVKRDTTFFLYGYIFQALFLMALTSTSFILMGKDPTSYFNILAHIIRVSYYSLLFVGIFGRAVNYPYEKLEEILNHLPLAVVTYDHDYRLTFANKRAEEIVDGSLKEWYGSSDDEINKVFYDNSQKHFIRKISSDNVVLTKEIYTMKTYADEQKKIVVDAYRLESGGYQAVFDEARKVQALDNLLLQTQTILNSINNLIIILDNEKRILMCNNKVAQALGKNIKDLVGLNFLEFMKVSALSDIQKVLKALSGKSDATVEVTLHSENGAKINLLLQIDNIINIDGETIGSIGVGTDITDLIRDKEEKLQQEKLALLGQMAAGIVHEIRNPLTAILGFSSLIKTNPEGKKTVVYADYIEEEVIGLNKIVTDYLTFAKPSPLMLNDISPNKVIESLKPLLDSHTLSKGINMVYDLHDNIKTICADEGQIKQVILNIVQNAADALNDSADPEIKISTGYDHLLNHTFIRIHNNGRALTEEEKIKIGTPFFTTKVKGTGLGLSICHQIIRDHGGQIKVQSYEGFGTAFELYFPVKKTTH